MKKFLSALFFLLLSGPVSVASTHWVQTDFADARLIAAPQEQGAKEIQAGVHIRLKDGWKTYWRTPGDAGFPPTFDWTGSENFERAIIHWPAPARFTLFGFETFGYAEEIVFPVSIQLQNPAAPFSLKNRLSLLVCKDICIPLEMTLSLDSHDLLSTDLQLINHFKTQVPAATHPDLSFAKIERGVDFIRVTMRHRTGFSEPDFVLETEPYLALTAPEIVLSEDGKTAILTARLIPNEFAEKPLTGQKIRLTLWDGPASLDVHASLPDLLPVESAPSGFAFFSLMLGLAFLGGLILNVMPCVLPVLSLKLFSVITNHNLSLPRIRLGFLASGAGIIASFLLLAVMEIILKLMGKTLGWGVQFQQPIFLIFMIGVLLVFAANLWGLFSIPIPRFMRSIGAQKEDHSLLGQFFLGVFATLLATPCSAPFLGTAVGFALSRSPFDIVLIFTVMGTGFAMPYFVFAAFPAAVKILPKPGRWMVIVRRVLSFALVGFALWLGSILLTIKSPSPEDHWQKFDPAALSQHVSEGKTVFVDITAAWCLTCQVNKNFVLKRAAVQDAFSQHHAILMRGDWTQKNDTITTYLQSFGRYGVPFNVVYGPAAPSGLLLPEILTVKQVVSTLEKVSGKE